MRECAIAKYLNIRWHTIKDLEKNYLNKKYAKTSYHANKAFNRWCKLAEATDIPELKTMSKTIQKNIDGIKTYWTFRGLSNAKVEGFNNKIRWLIKQAYGFRDREYLKLKIYQLPEISSLKEV